ncbi:NTF2-like N-terminal transpeptidase domain-containing protein [Sphaerisporangium aureirubrum]|uniref:NTF2-like N-terminal transpeptidase domain-containing protein n=1 Tax=Sphaerisporangium aureirubrum TaxID=1544736 RepID=A0ABW1NPU6_9ACTN
MRRRGVFVLIVVTLVIVTAAVVALIVDARRVHGTPEAVGKAYLGSWAADDLEGMRDRVAAPPGDFAEQHRRLTAELQIISVKLTPGTVVRRGERSADMPFSGVRQIGELGQWRFSGVLHLAVRDGEWKVIWTPSTLTPGVAPSERLRLAEITVPGTELLTRQGRALPQDSGAETYFDDLVGEIDDLDETPPSGWAIEAVPAAGRPRRLVVFRPPLERRLRTTLDWWTEAAADRALDGVDRPAAIVAVRPSTGEVLAVADRLPRQGAFSAQYPPGPAFETVAEPATLRDNFGFGARFKSGLGGRCGSAREPAGGGSRASVTATPLCMALLAAAAQNGTWRPPRLMSERAVTRLEGIGGPRPKRLSDPLAVLLRTMITPAAAGEGLPTGVSARSGTAPAASGNDHAWFVGYRGDLAFAVFVEHGGPGSAAPAAARFLRAL